MVAGKRLWALMIVILAVGALVSACGTDDCWNNCQTWSLTCRQNCNVAWPTFGPDWEQCISTCDLETIACQNDCFWGEGPYIWW